MIVINQKIFYYSFLNENYFYRYHKNELIITRMNDLRERKYYLNHPQQIRIKDQKENISILSIDIYGCKSIYLFKHNSMKLQQVCKYESGNIIGNQKYAILLSNDHCSIFSNFKQIRKIKNKNLEQFDRSIYMKSRYCRPMLNIQNINFYKRDEHLKNLLKDKVMDFFKMKNTKYYSYTDIKISFLQQFIILRPKQQNKIDLNLYVDVGFIQFNERFYGEISSEKDFTLMSMTYNENDIYALFNHKQMWKVEKIVQNQRSMILEFNSQNAYLYKNIIVYFSLNQALIQSLSTMAITKIIIEQNQQ